MITVSLYTLLLGSIAFTIFKTIEVIKNYQLMDIRNRLLVNEMELKQQVEKYYRARTWEVIVRSKGDRKFTEEELDSIHAMGLGDLLDE